MCSETLVFRNTLYPIEALSLYLGYGYPGLLAPRCDCEPIFRIPLAEQRLNGVQNPGDRSLSPYLLPRPPELWEPIYCMGRVDTEFPSSAFYWAHFLPVHTMHQATSVPIVPHLLVYSTQTQCPVPRSRGRPPQHQNFRPSEVGRGERDSVTEIPGSSH